MTRLIIHNSVRFILLVMIQVLILNHLNLGGYANAYLYVYFILVLPFATPRWLLLVLAFFLGLVIDIFTFTPGLNASATVAMAWFRPAVIRFLSSLPEEEMGVRPSLREQGFTWFFSYASLLVIIHHFILFYLEIFRFSEFFQTLIRNLISVVFTLVLILLSETLVYYWKRKPDR